MALQTTDENGMRQVRRTVTIRRSPEELYLFWRNFAQLPLFMDHVESVTVLNKSRSHWIVKAPAGRSVEWDAEISDQSENERITWQSLLDAEIHNSGTVRFTKAPAELGTEVCVTLSYDPPAGAAGVTVAKLFGEEPSQQLDEDLYRFKQLMETGRIVTTDGQTHGKR